MNSKESLIERVNGIPPSVFLQRVSRAALINCDGLEIQMTMPRGAGVNESEERRKVSVKGTDVIQRGPWIEGHGVHAPRIPISFAHSVARLNISHELKISRKGILISWYTWNRDSCRAVKTYRFNW